jgi:hypothetical protein
MTTRASVGPSVEGFVDSTKPSEGPIFVGLFPAHIPQSRPVGGALLTSPDAFCIGPVPDGIYHLLAAALPRPADTLGYLLPDSASLSVGAGNGPVIVREGQWSIYDLAAADGPDRSATSYLTAFFAR